MPEVNLQLNDQGQGAFFLIENNESIGEMVVSIAGKIMTVYHTEVDPVHEGKGFAKLLLNAMTEKARLEHLKVRPLCPYVHAQFARHKEEYADLWLREEDVQE
jgi:predicted GNAT family acetyltransferase